MSGGAGTVIAGIDLETDLNRLITTYRLPIDLGLSLDGTQVTELRSLYRDLEVKRETRTQELETVAQTARAISASLDLDAVLWTIVRLIQQRLGFDHVGVFIIEPGSSDAVAVLQL
jgi:hypothetical protein